MRELRDGLCVLILSRTRKMSGVNLLTAGLVLQLVVVRKLILLLVVRWGRLSGVKRLLLVLLLVLDFGWNLALKLNMALALMVVPDVVWRVG